MSIESWRSPRVKCLTFRRTCIYLCKPTPLNLMRYLALLTNSWMLKSPGIDGLSPGLFKRLPLQWILTLSVILNNVSVSGYPAQRAYSRSNLLFKTGDNMNCDDYRGISVINCISKTSDYVLYNRLSKWFTPHKDQAGGQPKKGCIEHILSLRLIIYMCRQKNGNFS